MYNKYTITTCRVCGKVKHFAGWFPMDEYERKAIAKCKANVEVSTCYDCSNGEGQKP